MQFIFISARSFVFCFHIPKPNLSLEFLLCGHCIWGGMGRQGMYMYRLYYVLMYYFSRWSLTIWVTLPLEPQKFIDLCYFPTLGLQVYIGIPGSLYRFQGCNSGPHAWVASNEPLPSLWCFLLLCSYKQSVPLPCTSHDTIILHFPLFLNHQRISNTCTCLLWNSMKLRSLWFFCFCFSFCFVFLECVFNWEKIF